MADELTWTPAWRIRELIGKKELSPVEVVDHFLGRIEEHNPALKAFSHLDQAGAREAAKQAEQAVQQGDELGPLHGIPTAAKEHIAVKGMPVVHGGVDTGIARHDYFGVERLRQAGAVIVGLNTMMGSGGQMGSDGARAGRTFNWDVEARNPWDPTKVPGWSSSGGAASAVAALLPFTIGTDGGGSTRLPAAYSGVVGVHTPGGLIPNVDYDAPTAGVMGMHAPGVPYGTSVGALCRSAADAAIVTDVMAGPDGRDPLCLPYEPPSYVDQLDAGVDGWRFAWTDDYGFAASYASDDSPRVIALVRDAAMGFSSLGASVDATTETWEDPFDFLHLTAASYGPSEQKPSVEIFQAACEARDRADAKFRALLREHTLLLSPTVQRVARSVEEWNGAWTTDGGKYYGGGFASTYTADTFMFNWLKYPAVSVPCGFVDGLPVALQIIGLPGKEKQIFQAAQAFQTAFPRDERPAVS